MMADKHLAKSAGGEPLEASIASFLADLRQANRSVHTCHAYANDLAQFRAFCYEQRSPAGDEQLAKIPDLPGITGIKGVTSDQLRGFFKTFDHLSPATRARKQAALASFFAWAYRHDLIGTNPMGRVDRVRLNPPQPRGMGRDAVEAILTKIPTNRLRDRVLFRLIFETGLRVGEALALYVEDIDLTSDDEHIRVLGKGGRWRTVLLDDRGLVKQLRSYLKQTGYKHGPLFRAEKNGRGGLLRYQSVQERWANYCAEAGIECTLHQLRHTHATELVNDGVSLTTIRKRLGHKNLQTTLRYAEQSDATADAELRAWRRRRERQGRHG
jgi:integrase/recombinase XerD